MGQLRDTVRERASARCEYCDAPDSTSEIEFVLDHIIAVQHNGPTAESNLALACHQCNRHKGPNIAGVDPETGELTRLFNPRTDGWSDHFRWQGERIVPKSAIGRVTEYVLALNEPLRLATRRSWIEEGLM